MYLFTYTYIYITGEPLFKSVMNKQTPKKLKLIVEIWVGGTENDYAPPIRTSYASYRYIY
jgi:hypothetical protein